MKYSKLIKTYIGTFQHFIEEGGYPLRISSDESSEFDRYLPQSEAKTLCKHSSAFAIEDGCLMLDKSHPFDDALLVEYWKFRFNEERTESNRLYSLIEDLHRKA